MAAEIAVPTRLNHFDWIASHKKRTDEDLPRQLSLSYVGRSTSLTISIL